MRYLFSCMKCQASASIKLNKNSVSLKTIQAICHVINRYGESST